MMPTRPKETTNSMNQSFTVFSPFVVAVHKLWLQSDSTSTGPDNCARTAVLLTAQLIPTDWPAGRSRRPAK